MVYLNKHFASLIAKLLSLYMPDPVYDLKYISEQLVKTRSQLSPKIQKLLIDLQPSLKTEQVVKLIFMNLNKIQDSQQIEDVVFDSVMFYTATNKSTIKIGNKFVRLCIKNFKNELEQVAILGQLLFLLEIKRPDFQIQSIVENQVNQEIEINHPLASPKVNQSLKKDLLIFIEEYSNTLQKNLTKIPGNIEQLNQLKTDVFQKTQKIFVIKNTPKQVELDALLKRISYILGLQSIPDKDQPSLGFKTIPKMKKGYIGAAIKLILFPDSNKKEVYYSLLGLDRSKLEQLIEQAENKNEKLNKAKLAILKKAYDFSISKKEKAQEYQSIFQNLVNISALTTSHYFAINLTDATFGKFPGIYVPQDHLVNETKLAEKIIGGLGGN